MCERQNLFLHKARLLGLNAHCEYAQALLLSAVRISEGTWCEIIVYFRSPQQFQDRIAELQRSNVLLMEKQGHLQARCVCSYPVYSSKHLFFSFSWKALDLFGYLDVIQDLEILKFYKVVLNFLFSFKFIGLSVVTINSCVWTISWRHVSTVLCEPSAGDKYQQLYVNHQLETCINSYMWTISWRHVSTAVCEPSAGDKYQQLYVNHQLETGIYRYNCLLRNGMK